jgi:hypothetical protein
MPAGERDESFGNAKATHSQRRIKYHLNMHGQKCDQREHNSERSKTAGFRRKQECAENDCAAATQSNE